MRKYASWSLPVTTHEQACTFWRPHMSFLSVEPQSRVVLESHSESLLAQFDAHLQIIADRYLAFFQERSVNFARVLHFTPTTGIRSPGDGLRQSSQLSSDKMEYAIYLD
jgi:hypothetical protein